MLPFKIIFSDSDYNDGIDIIGPTLEVYTGPGLVGFIVKKLD